MKKKVQKNIRPIQPKQRISSIASSSKIFVFTLLGFAIIAGLVLIRIRINQTSYQQSLVKHPTANPIQKINENWKTYSPTDENIQFRYPETWQLLSDEGGNYITDSNKKAMVRRTGWLKESTTKTDLHNYLDRYTSYKYQGVHYLTEKPIAVDEANGWYAHIKSALNNEEQIYVFIENNDLSDQYTGLKFGNFSSSDIPIFDQILSTFVFTNRDLEIEKLMSDSPIEWQSYENTNLKIKFEYPSIWSVKGYAGDVENYKNTTSTFTSFKIEEKSPLIGSMTMSVSQTPPHDFTFDSCTKIEKKPSSVVLVDGIQFSKEIIIDNCMESEIIIFSSASKNIYLSFLLRGLKGREFTYPIIDHIISTFKFIN